MSRASFASRMMSLFAIGLGAVALSASCSATHNSEFTSGSGGLGGGSSSSGDIGFGAGSQGGNNSGAGGSIACAAEPHVAQQVPLDIYIMLDQSGSMTGTVSGGQTKWNVVTTAIKDFLQQPGLEGVSVGIQYFGIAVCPCVTNADCAIAGDTCFVGQCLQCLLQGSSDVCDPLAYDKPEREIAPLPAATPLLIENINKHSPTTGTPTGPALTGAVTHAKTWLLNHPGHAVITLLATDGMPESCSPTDSSSLAQIAAQGAADGVRTFTIGVFESGDMPDGPNILQAIATAGKGQSFNFSTTQGNVGQAFLDALNVIRGAALGCQYTLPTPSNGTPDYTKVNVQYSPTGGSPILFDHYQDKAHCPPGGDGWYYDNNANPQLINLCDSTCTKVGADKTGQIDILLGCKTKEPT